MLDEQFFRFPLISVPAQTLDRDPVDRRQEWQSVGRSSLQTLLFVKFPLLSCNWLMLRHSLCDVMLVLAAGCPPVSCCLFLFSGCWHWQGYWIFCPGHLTTFHTICRHHHTLPRLTCSAREKISIRNSKTISGGIKSSKHSRKKFNKARMLSA